MRVVTRPAKEVNASYWLHLKKGGVRGFAIIVMPHQEQLVCFFFFSNPFEIVTSKTKTQECCSNKDEGS